MNIGTRSLLFGVHQVVLHPLLVAVAWWRLYRFREVDCPASGLRVSLADPRLWLAFLVHDWGYWRCSNMDGREGKAHPRLGARLCTHAFDAPSTPQLRPPLGRVYYTVKYYSAEMQAAMLRLLDDRDLGPWGRLCLLHSRSIARQTGRPPSALCAPNKLAIVLYPRWLYMLLARASGELWEYIEHAKTPTARAAGIDPTSPRRWYETVSRHMRGVAFRMVEGGAAGAQEDEVPLSEGDP